VLFPLSAKPCAHSSTIHLQTALVLQAWFCLHTYHVDLSYCLIPSFAPSSTLSISLGANPCAHSRTILHVWTTPLHALFCLHTYPIDLSSCLNPPFALFFIYLVYLSSVPFSSDCVLLLSAPSCCAQACSSVPMLFHFALHPCFILILFEFSMVCAVLIRTLTCHECFHINNSQK